MRWCGGCSRILGCGNLCGPPAGHDLPQVPTCRADICFEMRSQIIFYASRCGAELLVCFEMRRAFFLVFCEPQPVDLRTTHQRTASTDLFTIHHSASPANEIGRAGTRRSRSPSWSARGALPQSPPPTNSRSSDSVDGRHILKMHPSFLVSACDHDTR